MSALLARSCLVAFGLAWSIFWPVGALAQGPAIVPQTELFGGDSPAPDWGWQILPDGLLYRSYLAGPKEPRLSYVWSYDSYSNSWLNDATLGARVGILRLGTSDPLYPQGFEVDLEAAAMPRLTGSSNLDLVSADYRVGIPLTWREGPFQAKLAWYHVSSHVGDEYMLSHPDFQRINYCRDAFVLGGGWFPLPDLRLYGEFGYAFRTDGGAQPWELQFGWEYAPNAPTGIRGAPVVAMNAYLREEVNWGGNYTAMFGWAWRGKHLLRVGFEYNLSETVQWQFLGQSEQLFGLGIWYDF